MEKAKEQTIQDVISTDIPISYENIKLGEIQDYLEEKASFFDVMDYVYILDDDRVLKGVISLKQALSLARSLEAREVMHPNPISIGPEEEPENVVYLSLSHSLKSLPVTTPDNKFLGVVAHHDILKFFNQEVESDIFNFGGIFHKVGDEYTTISSSTQHMVRSRLPWLIIGVLGGIMAASIIARFEEFLSSFIALASFIPVMVYMSDAAGTQSEALIIRGLA
ncbi:MAG: CBS domain-containing protein, partial [Methanobacterium sp.]|nr:CBS domain-containing protein [Euryarchaeota archaeon]MBV1729142.1 CBS domain-containing protein [Methanobacterium sp.]